jgi:hypothetical protein
MVTARIVFRLLAMLSTVGLDDAACFQADEIDDIRTDRLLPFELEALQTVRAQMEPEQPFAFGSILS